MSYQDIIFNSMDFPYSKIYRLPPERPNTLNNLDYDDDDDTKARYEVNSFDFESRHMTQL